MSAPNAGRQSPDPKDQSDEQAGTTESGKVGAAPSEEHAKESSEDTKHSGLSSNPGGPLDAAANEKVTKDGRGNI